MTEPITDCKVNQDSPETPQPVLDPLPEFPNRDTFGAASGLVAVLNFLGALGIEYVRVDIDIPATLAYEFTDPRTGRQMRVVQYVDYDDGTGSQDELFTWAVRTYPVDEPTPCMVAVITEGGSRDDLWPDEASEAAIHVPYYITHRFCHTHRKLVEVTDDDDTDYWHGDYDELTYPMDEPYTGPHQSWCIGCDGDCMQV